MSPEELVKHHEESEVRKEYMHVKYWILFVSLLFLDRRWEDILLLMETRSCWECWSCHEGITWVGGSGRDGRKKLCEWAGWKEGIMWVGGMEGRNYVSGRDGRKELCEWAGWKEGIIWVGGMEGRNYVSGRDGRNAWKCSKFCVCACTILLFFLLFCCSRLLLSGHLGLVRVLSLPNMAVPWDVSRKIRHNL